MYDASKIHSVMWESQAGCVGLDLKTSTDFVWRLCRVLDQAHPELAFAQGRLAEAKTEIPANFRRSFVKAVVEVERKGASRGLMTDFSALLVTIPWYYFLFTDAGRRLLPRTPPAWLTSKWTIGFVIVGCLLGIGDIWLNISKIRNAPQRTKELEHLLL